MKKTLLFLMLAVVFMLSQAFSQCPGCAIDYGCVVSPAKPTLCPDTLPPGTAMQYYDEDITFYMPAQFVDAGTGFNVTLNRIEVTGVVGMPYGLSFESSSPTNNFYPTSNPPATEHGCAKFCGTPLLAGSYVITVYVKAYVTVMGMNQTEDDSFDIPIEILPATGGNSSFTMGNPSGCVPLTTTFTPIHQSQGNPHYSYSWDFGNGQTSTSEFPPSQLYDQPGSYSVSLSTTIDTLGYFLSSVTLSGNSSMCSDLFGGLPDYFIKILMGSTVIYQSSHVTNQLNVTFTFPTITLQDTIYYIEVWDNDVAFGGGATGDDFCGTVAFNGLTAGNHSYNINSMNVSFTVDHPILNFNETDTVHVYPLPLFDGFSFFPNDSVCAGDSIFLSTTGNYSLQWYHNGLALAGETDTMITAKETGAYHIILMNQYGCTKSSDTIQLSFLSYPPVPTFWQSGNLLQTMMSGYELQWLFDGNPIPGATGQTHTITQSGYYTLQASNAVGCATMSNVYYATYTNIEEDENSYFSDFQLYPNPADDMAIISFNALFRGKLIIQMTDVLGKIVFSELFSVENGHFIQFINVSHLPSGIYVLSLQTDEWNYQKKLIIQ